jgi:hypothetical protein
VDVPPARLLPNRPDSLKFAAIGDSHPLSEGGRHGSEVELRVTLEPPFVAYGVNVVYSGHDHIYERLIPQKGITYFVASASGELRRGDLKRSTTTAAGFDQDRIFMLNEVAGDDLFFQVGKTLVARKRANTRPTDPIKAMTTSSDQRNGCFGSSAAVTRIPSGRPTVAAARMLRVGRFA